MVKIDPKNYEYLWSDYDVNFIFVSCYLFPEFRRADIVLIYDWRKKELKFFLSKKQKNKFSNYGLRFYQKDFSSWKKEVSKNITEGRKFIKLAKKDKNKTELISRDVFKKELIQRVNLFQDLGGNYFYTEFFFLDKVEKLVKSQPGKYKKILNNLKKAGVLKLRAREILNHFYNYNKIFKPYIAEIAKITGRKDLEWLSYQEIIDLLDGQKVRISLRGKENWILTKKNRWKIIRGAEANEVIKNFNNHFFEKNKNIFEGQAANGGFYQGRVKIIRTIFSDKLTKEIKKVKKGDVLVANTTGPEIMVALRLAGAIITDEGGITSHAAIISRELNIPCVIATKIATQVLRDGDLVEVDANKGVVKILKKIKPNSE